MILRGHIKVPMCILQDTGDKPICDRNKYWTWKHFHAAPHLKPLDLGNPSDLCKCFKTLWPLFINPGAKLYPLTQIKTCFLTAFWKKCIVKWTYITTFSKGC